MPIIETVKSLALCSALALAVFACSRGADSNQDSTQVARSPETANPDAPIMLRGTVASISANRSGRRRFTLSPKSLGAWAKEVA
jgi:hypothetical protein